MLKMDLSDDTIRFLECRYPDTQKILHNNRYKDLKEFPRHKYTNTYDHSVRVAVATAIIAKRFGVNIESAIKTALVHDMCFANYYNQPLISQGERHKGFYAYYHPIEAAENASKEFGLTDEEIKAIKAHMFPLAVHIPTSKLALALTLADKGIAIYEGLYRFRFVRQPMMVFGLKTISM